MERFHKSSAGLRTWGVGSGRKAAALLPAGPFQAREEERGEAEAGAGRDWPGRGRGGGGEPDAREDWKGPHSLAPES